MPRGLCERRGGNGGNWGGCVRRCDREHATSAFQCGRGEYLETESESVHGNYSANAGKDGRSAWLGISANLRRRGVGSCKNLSEGSRRESCFAGVLRRFRTFAQRYDNGQRDAAIADLHEQA